MIEQELIFGIISVFVGLCLLLLVFLDLKRLKALFSPEWQDRLDVYKIFVGALVFLILGLFLIFR